MVTQCKKCRIEIYLGVLPFSRRNSEQFQRSIGACEEWQPRNSSKRQDASYDHQPSLAPSSQSHGIIAAPPPPLPLPPSFPPPNHD